MDSSEGLRQVLVGEFRAFLEQFRNDQNAALAADRAFYTGLIGKINLRVDRLELANLVSSSSSSLEASASTSFSSGSQPFSELEQASPVLHAAQVGSLAGRRENHELFMDPHDVDGSPIYNWGGDVTCASPSSRIAEISLSSERAYQHADDTGHPASAALSAVSPAASAFQFASTYDVSFRAHDVNADQPWSAAAPPAAEPSSAPIMSIPISYQLGVSAGRGNAGVTMADSSSLQPSWAPIPASYEPVVSSFVVQPALSDAAITGLPGRKEHNPRVCALCRYTFTEKK
jgi:hypothetical protein